MEQKELIRRSPVGLRMQIVLSGIAALLIGLLATGLFNFLLGWTTGGGATLQRLVWVGLALTWVLGSLKLSFDWKMKRYEITQDSLIVHAKAGKMGSSQTIYRYESIISLRMTQDFLGKRYGYGDVHLTIPKIDGEVVMNDIENPLVQLAEIQKHMANKNEYAVTSGLIT
jgi:hypothetical protein